MKTCWITEDNRKKARNYLNFLIFDLIKIYTMSTVSKHIVKSYANLFDGLDGSIKRDKDVKETAFYKSFGAFSSDKSTEDLVDEIRSTRKFRKKCTGNR